MLWPGGAETRSTPQDLYRFGSRLVVSIRGERRARSHFRAEYATAAVAANSMIPAVEVTIGAGGHEVRPPATDTVELRGAHKLASWRAFIPVAPGGGTMRVAVDVRGPLGLMLVQSYVVEPLVSLAAVGAGSVLLPSAAIAQDGQARLLIGSSRSGKSSLAARALAGGLPILGDDQVLIDGTHRCLPFPRRLRLYPDLARTAPRAFAALPSPARTELTVLGGLKTLTRGFVAPPLLVSASELGGAFTAVSLPIGEVVVIRRAEVNMLRFEHLDQGELRAEIEDALLSQRSRLFKLGCLRTACARLLAQERAIVALALTAAPARRVLVPAAWPAERAVGTLARELGLGR
jgi:hypothetical protein